MEKTFEELELLPEGTVLHDEMVQGIRFLILRGPYSLCAYAGLHPCHPLSGHAYDDLPVDAHGGLTFSGKGDGLRPKDFWWYGWDYSHCDDYAFYYDKGRGPFSNNKKWTVEEVVRDSQDTLYYLKKLMKLAEKIWNEAKEEPCESD